MKALVFGANGQDGYYLHKSLLSQGVESIGISRSGNWIHSDVANYEQVEYLVKTHQPNYIFHLAANSTTRHNALMENHAVISTGTLNILEAVYKHSASIKVFITGSGLQFENQGEPISENFPFVATNPYGIARIHSVYAARYYRSLGLPVYVGYLFHHESPLRKPNHVSKMISLAAQRIKNGSLEVLEIGDVSVRKEWTFAGDVVNGMMTLISQDEVFEAVIGSGQAYTIQDWLEECFRIIGKNWLDHVKLSDRFKPEYQCLVSNPQVINSLGWFPKISFANLANMMMETSYESSV